MDNRGYKIVELLVTILIIAAILCLGPYIVRKIKKTSRTFECQKNMQNLWASLRQYGQKSKGKYPIPSKWCDLLLENTSIKKEYFFCKSTEDRMYISEGPIDENDFSAKIIFLDVYKDHHDPNRNKYVYLIEWSHYAMNPNAEPNSAPDVVLLFETEHGWNQFGGRELISVKNHLEICGKEGCNILFNNGKIKFIKPEDVDKLNWGRPE